MEPQRKLYLFDGQTFITVPESSWLNELKAHPTGITALKSLEDSLILKGWVKTRSSQDPKSHASESEWLFEETGAKMQITVDTEGQVKADGLNIGPTTVGETFQRMEKIAEEKAGKWVTAVQEVLNEKGEPVKVSRRIYIPAEKVRKPKLFEGGLGTRTPADLTTVKPEKGGPHPTADVLSTQKTDAMNQLLGLYQPPLTKAEASKKEAVRLLRESGKLSHKDPKRSKEMAREAFKIFRQLRETKKAESAEFAEDILRACNLMLELARKEENEEEKKRLCEEVERQLTVLEACAKSDLKEHVQDLVQEEADATKEYKQMAAEADKIGKPDVKRTLTSISQDEAKHNKMLKEINQKLKSDQFRP